ncbi:hypothetical protein [Catenisphaera adipataccumulans]|uniref:Uncharacterized protein n=1 Tax=Catenisphaera adipataccumulans TaxID=700500 RepID=A0A7W8CX00_9FIRM|nr:hypothetical protein [Catenisphaera adipataccumulans]MBB5182866.1 hypothetical protein [Catenisphaera adipataccumulans]
MSNRDKYVGGLHQLELNINNDLMTISRRTNEMLTDFTGAMSDDTITDDDYMMLLTLYYYKYKKTSNTKGRLFCLVRMQQLMSLRRRERRQKEFPRITFTNYTDPSVKALLKSQPNLYSAYYTKYERKVLKADVWIYAILLVVLVLLFRMAFLWGLIISLATFFIVLLFALHSGYIKIMDDRFESWLHQIDAPLAKLDRMMRTPLK